MRHLALIICLIGSPAAANGPVTWSELLAPDRLMQSLAQSVTLTIRSFLDVTYTALDVDIRRGAVTVRNIKAYPRIAATDFADCRVEIRRLEINGAGLASPESIKLDLRADDLRMSNTCLMPPVSEKLAEAGLPTLRMPRAVLQLNYHVPSAKTQITGFAVADDLAELSFDVDLDYFWIDASVPDPYPVILLERAEVTLRNLGIWELLNEAMPDEALNPEVAPAILQLGAAQSLVEAGANEPFAVALSAQIAQAWSAFLLEPKMLAAAFEPKAPVFVDLVVFEDRPGEMLSQLAPTISATPITRVSPLSVDLLRSALSGSTNLSAEDRLKAGRQLATGIGAPRNIEAGIKLLLPLAVRGDEDALEAIAALRADAFRAEDYAKMTEVAVGKPDVVALLDDLEARIGLATAITFQADFELNPSFDGIATVQDLRSRALDHLEGSRVPRSFARAAYWAYLAAAAGDFVGQDVLADIEGRTVNEQDKVAWEAVDRAAASRALKDWIAADLPARLKSQ
ncbi:hypothetical protein A8B83_02335 [Rhodobacteraceae bacterium EhC02]|nr:hypothetical protein A8B83_02335 [Rhodobacteraceae bacterium EhC02]